MFTLLQVRADLEPLVNLVGSELPDRNAANQLRKRILAEAQVDLRNLHKLSGYHGRRVSGTYRSGYPLQS